MRGQGGHRGAFASHGSWRTAPAGRSTERVLRRRSAEEVAAGKLQRGVSRHCLPNTRHKSLRSCRVLCVFFAKRLAHHLLFRLNTKRDKDCERDKIRRTCDPVRDDERLANGIQHQCRVHRMADPTIHALRDESMLLTDLKRDRPIRAKISVRLVEEPKADHKAEHPCDEWPKT